MADDEKELDLEEGAEEETEDGGKSKKKLIIIAAGAILLIVVAAAAYFFLFAGSDDEGMDEGGEEVEEVVLSMAQYLPLDPSFIVNFSDRGRQRFLQADITIMTRDPSVIMELEEHMPMVRHSLTSVLSAGSLSMLQSSGGVSNTQQQVTTELQRLLSEELGGGVIEQVLFTTFVMQ